jgi:beta-lactamase regulating signal transducer with metallopeptidase domain
MEVSADASSMILVYWLVGWVGGALVICRRTRLYYLKTYREEEEENERDSREAEFGKKRTWVE